MRCTRRVPRHVPHRRIGHGHITEVGAPPAQPGRVRARQLRGKDRAARTTAEDADAGHRRKAATLGEALTRLIDERSRRTARPQLVANARKALAMKLAAARQSRPSPGRTANEGMKPQRKERVDRIGSAMEAGRVSQFVRDAQAKRDGTDG